MSLTIDWESYIGKSALKVTKPFRAFNWCDDVQNKNLTRGEILILVERRNGKNVWCCFDDVDECGDFDIEKSFFITEYQLKDCIELL